MQRVRRYNMCKGGGMLGEGGDLGSLDVIDTWWFLGNAMKVECRGDTTKS